MEVIGPLVADTNAIVDFVRHDRTDPPPLRLAIQVLLPLPAVGELFAGAYYSGRIRENLSKVEEIVATWAVLAPDLETSRVYGRLRGSGGKQPVSVSRMNDLWIAALCIQHSLPLLSNDRGFDAVPGLSIIHW